LAALILDAQEAMKQRMDRIKAIGGDWQPHVLGDLDAQYWLLKDDINLTVDLPTAQGPVMLVDLPGGFSLVLYIPLVSIPTCSTNLASVAGQYLA
jgi:hypothetical protein